MYGENKFLSTVAKIIISRVGEKVPVVRVCVQSNEYAQTPNVRSSRLLDLHGSRIEMCRCKVQLSTIQRIVLLVRITVLECLATCTSFLEIGAVF